MTSDFMTSSLQQSRFERAVATVFDITRDPLGDASSATIRVTLETVSARPAPTGYEQFAALFRGPVEPSLPQGVYHFHHADLGELPLFMVPVGRDLAGTVYEVCVSRKIAP